MRPTTAQLIEERAEWRRAGRCVVFTNGRFDLLHPGHIALLEAARGEGDVLVVGLNSDASVRVLKGAARPVVGEAERAETLLALEAVDRVLVYDDPNPEQTIAALVPDVLVKGSDWAADAIVGRAAVEAAGGRVVRVELVPGRSTSALLQRDPHAVTAAWLAPITAGAGFRRAKEQLARDGKVELAGLGGTAAFLVPLLLSERPLLVVVASERALEEVASDLSTLAAEVGRSGGATTFPAPGPPPFRGLPRHPDAALARARCLHGASRRRLAAIVASPAGLLRPVLARRLFETRVFSLAVDEEMTPEILLEALDEGGYRRDDPVVAPGQLARRGGIVDFFPPDLPAPVRVEFLGDTICSLRRFDPETQRTTAAVETLEVLPLQDLFVTRSLQPALVALLGERLGAREAAPLVESLGRGLVPDAALELLSLVAGATTPLFDHLDGFQTLVLEPESVRAEAEAFHLRAREDRERRGTSSDPDPAEALVGLDRLAQLLDGAIQVREIDLSGGEALVASRPVRRYAGDLRALVGDLRARRGSSVVFLGTVGRAGRVKDVLLDEGLSLGAEATREVRVGALSRGFELPASDVLVLSDGDVFPEEVHLRGRLSGVRSFLSDFRDLRVGDMVVHQDHGIGRFEGLETLDVAGMSREFMVLSYQGGDKLKVPVEAFDRVQKYASAGGGATAAIDRLGSGSWEKTKKRVRKAMRDMAAELLALYARRKARPGHAFTAHSPWQHEFEESFEYEETQDQHSAIADVASDMSSPHPMDRLICGDVGYGKTEVAMRAAMRAVLDGKQVAVLAPTTILAFQHWKTFRKRFAPFPVTVEMVSRFRSPKEIAAVLAGVGSGKVDVLIGTHRLLSKDVAFRDLGLVVVDEEQRFGVAAKERLKHLRTTVDCLTLSATPIPRTLQMGLSGIRDMSVIETPPKDRLSIQTSVVKFSTDTIAAALRQELARDGQAYFVHNRVESIYSVASLVQRLVPEARVGVAHGQMKETELERQMLAFVEGKTDVLVATTIIENGLDIPRVNTLLVNRADRYGLAQLYQLRGRVGRSDRRAYAYLLVPPDTVLSEVARKRLAAIQEFSDLGAGFRIAALDLELRGAGNLLGGEQSGHIHAVGLDLYVKLLEQTILELRGEERPEAELATLNLKLDLRIPEGYVPEVNQRMALYKRVSQARDRAEIEALRSEVKDRYGAPPPSVESLFRYAALRRRARDLKIAQVDLVGGALVLRPEAETPLTAEAALDLVRSVPGARLTPPGVLRLPIGEAEALGSLEAALERLAAPLALQGP